MGTNVVLRRLCASCAVVLSAVLAVFFVSGEPASANSGVLDAWVNTYDPIPVPGGANCQLCHRNQGRGEWNGYGWDIRLSLTAEDASGNLICDGADGSMPDGTVTYNEAVLCVEALDSDFDPGSFSNVEEIELGTQPGWTDGPNNTIFTQTSEIPNQEPPVGIDPYDPDGTGGTGGTGGMGGQGGTGGDEMFPPGQFKRGTIVVVSPGQSIQKAIDRAQEGTRIYILAGDYTEPNNTTNGLNITKSGIHLIGQSNSQKRVRLLATNGQRNGIVVVPPDVPAAAQPRRPGSPPLKRTDCMGCHTDMGPPFPRFSDVPNVIPMDTDPWLHDIVIQGITVEGFSNNGIFTEHVDGFVFDDVESINNRNYGIFPVLSKNGVIKNSYSTGSDLDSALWVETSENVLVQGNVVENSTNGIEVSNSDDVLVVDNEMRNNAIGAAILLLPDIYDNRDSAKRIDLHNNWIHDNNNRNGARPGSILSFIPRGQGILYVGVDESVASGNLVENNNFVGIAVVDYCLPFEGTPYACGNDSNVTLEFLFDQAAEDNRIADNELVNNGTMPDPGPFQDFAAELTLLTLPASFVGLPGDDTPYHRNCYENNQPEDAYFFSLFDATIGVPPPWTPPPCQ